MTGYFLVGTLETGHQLNNNGRLRAAIVINSASAKKPIEKELP
jgi:hypothetical protein